MRKKRKTTTDAVEILDKTFIKNDPKRLKRLKRIRQDLRIAEQIYNLRNQANLNQKDLANLIGTSQSDISRLEDADYDGYSVKMLEKIAAAVHCTLRVQFVPENGQTAYA